MIFKHYNFWLVIRVVLLLANVIATGLVIGMIGYQDLLFLPILLFVILVGQIIDLILFTNRTNREISRFINNLSHQDLTDKFDEKSATGSFKRLFRVLNKVVSRQWVLRDFI